MATRPAWPADWWGGRWREDFDRAAEAGQNAHRLSIEWSRIQPAPTAGTKTPWITTARCCAACAQRGMTALVTLHHFTDPLWLAEQGGWENEQSVARFGAFVQKVVEALKEYANLWVTINEPNVYAYSGWIEGVFPPGKKNLGMGFTVMTQPDQGPCRGLPGHPPRAAGGAGGCGAAFSADASSPTLVWPRQMAGALCECQFQRIVSRGAARRPVFALPGSICASPPRPIPRILWGLIITPPSWSPFARWRQAAFSSRAHFRRARKSARRIFCQRAGWVI